MYTLHFEQIEKQTVRISNCFKILCMTNTTCSLVEGESVIFEEGASHFHNYIAVGGQLRLTNRRIIFKSLTTFHYQHELVIWLDQVSNVEFFMNMFMNPNGLALMMKDGQIENFIVDDRKTWRERILRVVTQAA